MPTTVKKSTAKAAVNSIKSTHPTWIDMIKECIAGHPEDARAGVSRPTIKKFVETKYHIDLNATSASQLNRAIAHGSEKGIFVLPRGPSGKVKLAPKSARTEAAKENAKPLVKKLTTAKPTVTKVKPGSASTPKSITAKKPVPKTSAKPKTTITTVSSKKPAAIKKAPAKNIATTKKVGAAKKPATLKKTITAKKGVTKKILTGETKKPASTKPKSKTTTAASKANSTSKPKSATKAKPTPKVKPASKTKPVSAPKPEV